MMTLHRKRYIAVLGIVTVTMASMASLFSAVVAQAANYAIVSQSNSRSAQIWWPVSGVSLGGTQPFKAALTDSNLDEYTMFWQVDGGQRNSMYDSWTDSPHKEAMVNVTSWSWKGSGPYRITFTAVNGSGQDIAASTVDFNIPSNAVPGSQNPVPATTTEQSPIPVPAPIETEFAKFYVNSNSDANRWYRNQTDKNSSVAKAIKKIVDQPQASWFGEWNSDLKKDVKTVVTAAAVTKTIPVLVAYNIPQRDCGGYSAGGSGSADAYRTWIRSFAEGIADRQAWVILEPDALSNIDCLSDSDQQSRYQLMAEAVRTLKANSKTRVYLDAGHSGWHSADVMTSRLNRAGVNDSDGFSLNVSNFVSTSDTINYGKSISSLVGKHFVIDTSRNGSGPTLDNQWCNPSGRSLGSLPTTNTGDGMVDGFIWIKPPGSSDGSCNGGPAAGEFWPEYAAGLVERSAY